MPARHKPTPSSSSTTLPYANLDEKRDGRRQEFYGLCLAIVKTCKTPAEAAQKLNTELFANLKVGYSTQRKAANQSPKESIEQGKASCTGLSSILSDACRSVCVPARFVGTPLWADRSGNHTWVEIWDKDWHFTGACEPDPNGLDRRWFTAIAADHRHDGEDARRPRQPGVGVRRRDRGNAPGGGVTGAARAGSRQAASLTLPARTAVDYGLGGLVMSPPVTTPLRYGEVAWLTLSSGTSIFTR